MLFFPHIPKAGGTTLANILINGFGRDNVLRTYQNSADTDIEPKNFTSVDEEMLTSKRAVFGHLTVKGFLKNKYAAQSFFLGKVRVISSVRDPIERMISEYNYILRNKKHHLYRETLEMTPEQFFATKPPNFMAHYLSPDDEVDLNFIHTMLTIVPMHGSNVFFSDYIFHTTQGLRIPAPILNKTSEGRKINRSRMITLDDISDDLLSELLDIHRLDRELYRSAVAAQSSA